MDFGLAKANSQLEKSEPGIIKGKFSYLSPEAAHGQEVDAATDIFAVGIILWELLAGRRLFIGETDFETVRMVQQARVPSIRQFNPKVSAELERVMLRALAGDPAARYQTARDFGRDLNNMLFHMGRAVSSFDIAQLVEPIRLEREDKKKLGQVRSPLDHRFADRRGIVRVHLARRAGSGRSGAKRRALLSRPGTEPRRCSSARSPAFRAGAKIWHVSGSTAPRAAPSGDSFDFGNLAALEDDPLGGRARSEFPAAALESSTDAAVRTAPGAVPCRARRPSRSPRPNLNAASQQLANTAPRPVARADGEVEYPTGKSKRGMIAAIVVLVAIVGAAGAYFGGARRISRH